MESATAAPRSTARYGSELKTMPQVRRDFLRRTSPWAILAAIVALGAARAAIGDFTWRDAVAAAGMVAIYPFGEWAIHVFILHMKPIRVRGGEHRTLASRAHGVHHRTPNDLDQL